jgi:hypothetical protein
MRLDSSSLINGLADMQLKVERATNLYAETAGMKMINDAKLNAPWTDRTGNSRQTMDYKITKSGTTTRINLRGNTPQFKYLELCHEKKNAILWPTIQRWSGQVLSGWSKII